MSLRRRNVSSYSSRTFANKETISGSPTKAPIRRTRSVSVFPGSQTDAFSEFSIKRDNPLFCNSPPPPDDGIEAQIGVKVFNFEDISSSSVAKSSKGDGLSRGRSVLGANRSSSTAEMARRGRSVSRRPIPRANSMIFEIGEEQERIVSKKSRNMTNLSSPSASSSVKNGALHRTMSNCSVSDQIEGVRTRNRLKHFDPPGGYPNPFDLSSMKTPNWEDSVSSSSMSELDEMSFQAVPQQMESVQDYDSIGVATTGGMYETVRSEVRRADSDIQKDSEIISSDTAIQSSNANGTPPDFPNPGGIELELDLRREYVNKLEQAEERARELRAELAIEEQRRMELTRILKEEPQETKTSTSQRVGRNLSFERRKISKALSEEAMAYFDECVSLSTFDSTDFSSLEEPPINIVGGTTVESPDILPANSSHSRPNDEQEYRFTSAKQTPISVNEEHGRRFQFSFSSLTPRESSEFQQDIRKYVKTLDQGIRRVEDESNHTRSKPYDPDEYKSLASQDGLLFDHVFFKNRLDSGSMLLCGGNSRISFSPYLK